MAVIPQVCGKSAHIHTTHPQCDARADGVLWRLEDGKDGRLPHLSNAPDPQYPPPLF